jgi:hypothetical protein
MKSKCALLVITLWWPVLISAEMSQSAETAVQEFLAAAGAPRALAIHVPRLKLGSSAQLVLGPATVMNTNVAVRLRCRARKECGEMIATIQYGSEKEAKEAAARLTKTSATGAKLMPMLIRAGTRVELILADRRMTLRLRVEALSSGGCGQRIRVRDRQSKRIYAAVITGPAEVRGE